MRPRTISRGLCLSLLASSMASCSAGSGKLVEAPPPPVETRVVYRPLDAGLLVCKTLTAAESDAGPLIDFDAMAEYAKAVDAWLDCSAKLAAIRDLYAGKKMPAAGGIDGQ